MMAMLAVLGSTVGMRAPMGLMARPNPPYRYQLWAHRRPPIEETPSRRPRWLLRCTLWNGGGPSWSERGATWQRDAPGANLPACKRQVKEGTRPPRDNGRRGGIRLVQINVTHANTWEDEMMHGSLFANCDFAAIQEQKLRGESKDLATRKLQRGGWDSVLDDAYFKVAAIGGGTALLADLWSGVRPIGDQAGQALEAIRRLHGRASFGVVDVLGGLLMISFYGLNGQPPRSQIPFWLDLGTLIKILGLPFCILGDWQITPRELRGTGWLRTMGAEIVAPSTATNLVSKRTIDYAVMSEGLVKLVQSVDTVLGARFSPHALAVIHLRCPRALGEARRLSQPRLHEVARPDAGERSKVEVDWSRWLAEVESNGDEGDDDDDDLAARCEQWYASADLELCAMFGIVDTPEEAHRAGLGLPQREVAAASVSRRRGAPDEGGVLGHRLAWASKGLHLATLWFGDGAVDDGGRIRRHTSPEFRRAQWLLRGYACRAGAFMKEHCVMHPSADDVNEAATLHSALTALAGLAAPLHDLTGSMSEPCAQALVFIVRLFFKDLEHRVASASAALQARRRRRTTRVLRMWARAASSKEAHAATKAPEVAAAYSASAEKWHRGERTAQAAADRGIVEWGGHWDADEFDVGGSIQQLVQQVVTDGPNAWFVP